jgi:hypothetical protein
MKKNILTLFSIAVLVGCSKKEDANPELLKLPPATQTGVNTCGCVVNGKAWIIKPVAPNTFPVQNIGSTFFFYLNGPDSSSLNFVLRGYTPTVNINLNLHNGMGWSSFSINGLDYGSYQNPENAGGITFTRFDTANKIMSGSFRFSYKSPNGNQQSYPDQILSDCRFDFKYQKL